MTSIHLTIGVDVVLDVDDVWPDGDHPTTITAAAVKDVIDGCGGMFRILRDWNLDECIVGAVTVDTTNPHWVQDDALIPELAPPRMNMTSVAL